MGFEAVKKGPASLHATASAVAFKAVAANLSAGVIGAAALFFIGDGLVPGFLAGFSIGTLNLLWLLKTARKVMLMPAEKAGRLVTVSYYVRFALTVGAVVAIAASGWVNLWSLMAGLSVSVFTTIASMVLIAREEASQDA